MNALLLVLALTAAQNRVSIQKLETTGSAGECFIRDPSASGGGAYGSCGGGTALIDAIEGRQSGLTAQPAGAMSTLNSFVVTEDRAYWVYMGRTVTAITATHCRVWINVAGGGTQVAEIALASTPGGPVYNTGQSLTKIAATGSLDTLSVGVRGNASSLAASIPADTHLWCGMRTAFTAAEPSIMAAGNDMDMGTLLITSTAGALTGSGPWTGTVPAMVSTSGQQAPYMVLSFTVP